MKIEYDIMTGEQIREHLPLMATLRSQSFKEFPYLYDGSVEAGEKYLATYAETKDATVIIAKFNGEIIGFSTGLPLNADTKLTRDLKASYQRIEPDLARYYYFGEIIILPEFRGQGIARAMYDKQQTAVAEKGYTEFVILTVVRQANHPCQPKDYRSTDSLWPHLGFKKSDITMHYPWAVIDETGHSAETDNTMQAWNKTHIPSLTKNYYSGSWEFYKAHTETFTDDYDYYLELCQGKKTLELFAGYGRLSNHLVANGVDLETVELEPELAKFINLTSDKNHVCDVLAFKPTEQYDVVIAAYDSFCLLQRDEQVRAFFEQIEAFLRPGGIVSLSYYHHAHWGLATGHTFTYQGKPVQYHPSHDLSEKDKGKGTWIDKYTGEGIEKVHQYPVKLYSTGSDLHCFFKKGSKLKPMDEVENFNNLAISEPGWVDYVFQKTS